MSKLPYEIGTRYCNSEIYDEATAETVHGWQIFVQKRADGAPTGERSFVDQHGALCGVSIAKIKRDQVKASMAGELAEVLRLALPHVVDNDVAARIEQVLQHACGVRE